MKWVKNILIRGVSLLAVLSTGLVLLSAQASAATITVNNADDTTADDGICTFREAIATANTDTASGANGGECAAGSGVDTINFVITAGGTTFTNQSQTGYTISLTSQLPDITQPVVINGYTQPGSDDNNTIAPLPFDAILLIQIDGSGLNSGERGLNFVGSTGGAAGSEVRGLVLNGFENSDAIRIDTDGVIVQGNYIGTTPNGLAVATTAEANSVAVNQDSTSLNSRSNVLIGGTDANDRNILSGQTDAASYPYTGWIIQGNYIGLGADGSTMIPNSTVGTPGSLSIDACDGVLVGGTTPGAANVISGNNSYGIAPDIATNLTIAGNYIGTDYTGTVAKPNTVGIIASGNMAGSMIGGTSSAARNIISGNIIAGIVDGGTGGHTIAGNYVGLDINGVDPISNGAGVLLAGVNITLGGSEAGRNVISGNTSFNVSLQGIFSASSGMTVSGNYIGTNASGDIDTAITAVQGEGVRISANTSGNIIGGTLGNRIAGNRGNGVAVRSVTEIDNLGGGTLTPTNNAILGNQIYGNSIGGPITNAEGLGIDIYGATINNIFSQPAPADFTADTYNSELGITLNDASDSDTGPNNYMNFPVINTAIQNGTALTINFDLDAVDSTNGTYRVEFFANDTTDPTGYGEGQTFLGSTTVANGVAQEVTLTLANGTDLTGKSISATTTAINNTTASGFGATSEFSEAMAALVTTPATTPTNNLADTGNNVWLYGAGIVSLLGVGVFLGFRRQQFSK